MKTTVDIPDSLFAEAKACAESRGVSFRQVLEDGLRTVIQKQDRAWTTFKLRDGSFGPKNRRVRTSWPAVRKAVYEGRGE
jgi:hypothetical protein